MNSNIETGLEQRSVIISLIGGCYGFLVREAGCVSKSGGYRRQGNHLRTNWRYCFDNYHEKQADVFVAFLLMPEAEFEKPAGGNLSIYDLAEKFEVLPYVAKFRIGLAKHYSPKKYAFLWGHRDPPGKTIDIHDQKDLI